MSFVGNKPSATLPPSPGMVKSDGLNLQTAVAGIDYIDPVAVTASVVNSVTNKVEVVVNGTTYYLLATTSPT